MVDTVRQSWRLDSGWDWHLLGSVWLYSPGQEAAEMLNSCSTGRA